MTENLTNGGLCYRPLQINKRIILVMVLVTYTAVLNIASVKYITVEVEAASKQKLLVSAVTCKPSNLLPKQWCMDNNDTPRYIGDVDFNSSSIVVRHYTHQGFEKCLAGKTIVFIGDSTVRYQFMHLVGFLKFRRFMRCQDYNRSTLPDDDCYLIGFKDLHYDWTSWYKQSTIMTGSYEEHSDQQYSLCDCFRPDPFVARLHALTTYEYRFVKRSTSYGEINIIYLQNFRDRIRLNQDYPPFSSYWSTKRCKTGECGDINRTFAFDGDTNSTFWTVLPLLKATHVFTNLGWGDFNQLSEFSCKMKEFNVHHPDINTYLMSRLPSNGGVSAPHLTFNRHKLKCQVSSLDRAAINKDVPTSWYWDSNHALSILNEEYNHQLSKAICPMSTT
ncbi:hypothetical protein ACHAW6_012582 [Cyclotella cf. meneghiniana]